MNATFQGRTSAKMRKHLVLLALATLVVSIRDNFEKSPLDLTIMAPAEAILLPVSFASLLRIELAATLHTHTLTNAKSSQKARICFNSMSSTFQSECVYCDSRLYTSTVSMKPMGQEFIRLSIIKLINNRFKS